MTPATLGEDAAPTPDRLSRARQIADELPDLRDLPDLGELAPALLEEFEHHTGLPLGPLRVLHALNTTPATIGELASILSEAPADVHETVTDLLASGLLRLHGSLGSDHARLEITEPGRVRVDQLTALHLRHAVRRV